MKASIILLIVICGLTKAVIRDHVYVNIPKSWTDAQSYCRKYYEDLSTITSQEEQDMLIQLAGGNSLDKTHHTDLATITTERQLQLIKTETTESQTESVWTGLRYLAGEWFWVNNKTLGIETLLQECPTQPYRCGARNTKTDKWENRDCDEKLNFICN
ncbi:hypothetical protein M9458_001561 [Cirrhinus mrigala]|uniref:C-type lectin domain-containing protein n=1 Tax=Cirrhinus mrigala TaxID=683832 RepID=A0ABD0RYB2_CIRMR